tara:strand:- start:3354 stop:3695 length:342 start_codon:yes stop_codon:yes gene_type:complete
MTVSDTILRAAINESKRSTAKFKHSSVLYKGRNKVLVTAHNEHKTSPLFGSGDYDMLHSEGAAIKKAVRLGMDLRGMKMYNYRTGAKGAMLSKPCPCCQQLLEAYGIEVTYSE